MSKPMNFYTKAKPFTFAKATDENIPSNIDQSTFNNEREVREQPNEGDEDEFEVDDDLQENGSIDRHFLSNSDLCDEHYPDNDIV